MASGFGTGGAGRAGIGDVRFGIAGGRTFGPAPGIGGGCCRDCCVGAGFAAAGAGAGGRLGITPVRDIGPGAAGSSIFSIGPKGCGATGPGGLPTIAEVPEGSGPTCPGLRWISGRFADGLPFEIAGRSAFSTTEGRSG